MKKIILLFCFIFASCSLTAQSSKNAPMTNTISWESITNSGILLKKITWTGELIFPECISDFRNDNDPKIIKLTNKIEEYWNLSSKSDSKNWSPFFWRFLQEYCNTWDGKYIFYSSDKVSPSFGRYDEDLDIIEEARFIRKYFDYVWWFHEFWAFWKRNWNVIEIKSQLPYPSYPNISPLKKPSNQKYCDNGLTPWGKKAECYYRIGYDFDFIKNTFTEKNICSFYKDDLGKVQVLESCFDVKY